MQLSVDESLAGIVAPYLIVNFTRTDLPAAFGEMHRALITQGWLFTAFHAGKTAFTANDFFVQGNSLPYTLFDPEKVAHILQTAGFLVKENIVRTPYAGEETTRAYLFAQKK